MREACCLWLSAADRARLAAIVADRNSPQKHVWRAQIILASADGCGTAEIMRRAGRVASPASGAGSERFMEAGVDGLLRDKTRQARQAAAAGAMVERVVELTLARAAGRGDALDRPRDGRGRRHLACARCSGSGRAHGLQPHRVRTFKLVQRPGVRRQAARRGRALRRTRRRTRSCCRSTRSRHVWMAPGSQGAG